MKNLPKLIKQFTILTGLLTVFVFIDYFTFGFSLFTIPLAILSAIITMVMALIKKDYLHVLINLILGIIAVVAFLVFSW